MKPVAINPFQQSAFANPFTANASGMNPFTPGGGMSSLTQTVTGQGLTAFGHINNQPEVSGPSFGQVLGNVAGNLNQTMAEPDRMLREHAVNGTYDIHDIMLANAKAELAINLTAQFTTKIVQAYDRILQIQV